MPEVAAAASEVRRIALAGNPNVGKTTLFNRLTGLRQKVANYPGVTVERKTGPLQEAPGVEVVDLPGTYSLNPKSMDEKVAYEVLAGRMDGEAVPDVVGCVVDATNLERNLYLATQVMDLGLPTVIALNMMDAAEADGLTVDVRELALRLGVPVVPISAKTGEGVDRLRAALLHPPAAPPGPRWPLQPPVRSALDDLTAALADAAPDVPERQRFSDALGALTSEPLLAGWADRAPDFHAAVLAKRRALEDEKVPYQQAEMMGRYGYLAPIVQGLVTHRKDPSERTTSDKIDAVLTHRVFGPVLFVALLVVIFQAVFSWAVPAMDAIEGLIGALSAGTRALLPDGIVEDVLVEGAIAGVGNVLIFLPQILLLFFFLGLMEDTGYMARTAFIMDRLMRRLGLSGASVVPLLSSYACAIPGIMAARTLPNERDRLITIMVAPLMSCSARLPVYVLFIAAFIPAGTAFGIFGYQGLAMFGLYVLGTLMAFAAAWVLKKFVFKGESSLFVMELPPYRLPQWQYIFQRMYDRSKVFVLRAGKIIFGLSILLWFLAAYPQTDPPAAWVAEREAARTQYDALAARATLASDPVTRAGLESQAAAQQDTLQALDDAEAGRQVQHSFIGYLGRSIAPVMEPLGFDWKISAGLVMAFAAREVIVSTLATLYSVGDADESSPILRDAIKADTYADGTPVFTPLVAVSLLVFFVFALQCMSTLAIARRETNTWKWPVVMWLYMFALAYLSSLLVYQGGQWLGWG